MIDPQEIPEFTGDLEQLEKDYGSLKKDAGNIRSTGADVHSQFQGLSAYYHAPEAEALFASTKPVSDRSDTFATDLETVSSALSGYATEIRPLVAKLKQLKTEATEFVASVKGDDDWEYDGDKVDKHNRIRDDITAAVAAFWAAERTCHNEITALWHGTQMIAGDGSDKKNQYGYNASDLKDAKLPWGDPVEEKHHWYEVGHWVKSFVWDGLIVDGVWGTIKGLGTLVGFGGWDAMGQAWKGLAQLATGLTLSMMPGAQLAFWALPDKALPSWFRESRNTMKQTGKALLAWDEWGKNPARAAGAVTFNVLTTVFTGGEGAAAAGAGKAGAVAKAVSLAGKAGKIIDPMTYVMKGAGAGLSKVGDIAKNLKGVGKIDVPTLPDGSVHLPDGRLLEPNGNLLDHTGNVETTPIPKEAAPGLPAHWTVPAPETAAVGVSHAVGNGAHGALPHVGNGIHGGIPKSVGDGVHGGIPHSAGNAVHGGAPHVPGNGIHGGIPKSVGDGIHGGIPKPVGDGVHGGVPHVPGNAVHGGVPHVPGSGVHGGVPHGTGDAVSAGGHAGTTPSAWYHETPTAPAHEVPHTTPHDAPPAGPHTGGHDAPGTGGHPDHGAGHDGAGHGGHDGAGHDAGHGGDHGGLDHSGVGHDAADIAGHDGVDAGTPGHSGTEVPGHGGVGEPFEYKPYMSEDDFDNLATDAEKHAVAMAELERGTNPAPSLSDDAGQAYGDTYWNDYLDNLDDGPRNALHTYSDYHYAQINSYLRGLTPDVSPHIRNTIDEMDNVMGTRPVPEDVMIIRGTGVDYLGLRSPLEMQGRTYPDGGYTSTALGETVPPPFDLKPVYMHLRVPKGTPALWIDHISANPGEREMLLASGTEYKVTRVFLDETDGKYHVYGEVLPRS
ncbi:ADP-ribosyltransferase [Streptomyces sp. NRRL F-525]|uniref:ADP-ribosyltransferase n=1 Tax=Streptomyces sp. NRRL F-525 TaxID=1463861 RepID=UPI0005241260|nr:ADP-ribosyltransferase [Streptomyces sp. NRRL F-525]